MKQFQKAARSRCKIKMAVQGPSGSGKTYSSLLIAYGITNDWSKIAVIDSENGSAHLYAHLGPYSVLSMTPPYTPEEYIEAINLAVKNGFECLVIDSLSAEWNGQGGILDIHSNIPGNSFTAWGKCTPRHNAFVQAILQANIHIIGTMRSKTDYVMQDKNGKQVPEKVGLKPVQREDAEYEFTLVFELTQRHLALVGKDRTGIFKNKPELMLNEDVGKQIAEWCNGISSVTEEPVVVKETTVINPETDPFVQQINACVAVKELNELFVANPDKHKSHKEHYYTRKNQIETIIKSFSKNGVH